MLLFFQIGGESILGLAIIKIRRTSNVNAEGAFLFGFVKTMYVMVPFYIRFLHVEISDKVQIETNLDFVYIELGNAWLDIFFRIN